MTSRATASTLNVQPRQRRAVYETLTGMPDGSSVRELLGRLEISESELRETLRKLETAGLARRTRGKWQAIPLETERPGAADGPEAAADDHPQD